MSYFVFPKSDNPIKASSSRNSQGRHLKWLCWAVFWHCKCQADDVEESDKGRRKSRSIMKERMNNHLLAATTARWNATKETSGNILQGSNRKDVFFQLNCSWTILRSVTAQKTAHLPHEVWQTPVVMVDVPPPTQQHTLEYRTTQDSSVTEQCHQRHNCSAQDYERAQLGCVRRKQNCGT
jgi:hypothetical protein